MHHFWVCQAVRRLCLIIEENKMELVLEVGMKLDKNLIEYHEMLTKHGLWLAFSLVTHDVYYIKQH